MSAQLFSTTTFNPNTFCHKIWSTFTAIYSQSAENREKLFINFYQRVQICGQYRKNYQDQTNSLWVIRHQVLRLNVLVLNSCASSWKKNGANVIFRRMSVYFKTLSCKTKSEMDGFWQSSIFHTCLATIALSLL